MFARTDLPIELAMTHRVGAGGERQMCARPDAVRSIAARMQTWRNEAETCKSCLARPALSIRAGVALCGHCKSERVIRSGGALDEHRGAAPKAARADLTPGGLRGHAVIFDSLSVDLGGFREIIRPAAVDRVIAEQTDLRALWNHNSEFTIGRKTAGTLAYWKETRGLAVEITPPQWASHYVESIQRRDISGMSFAFRGLEDDWHLQDGEPVREVFDMSMSEVSPVSFPAYQATSISVGQPLGSHRSSVEFLRKVHRTRLAR